MSIDHSAPRAIQEDEFPQPPAELKTNKNARPADAFIDVEEAEFADGFELPGAVLSTEEESTKVVPLQWDEFTCMSCFLVRHRSQLVREEAGKKYCIECEG